MKILKTLSALAISATMVFSVAAINVSAATTTQDGLEVSLTTDKETYSKDEKITATLSVKNTNSTDVTDVAMETIIPDGYEVADGTKNNKQFDKLAPNESAELKVVYVAEDSGEDSEDSEVSIVDPSNDSPKTGDNAILPVAIAVVMLVSVSLAILCFKSKKSRKLLSVILTVSIVGSSSAFLSMRTYATSDTDSISFNTIFLAENCLFDKKQLELNVIIKYAENDFTSIEKRKDIGEISYTEPDSKHIIYDSEKAIYYVDNQILITAKENTDRAKIDSLCQKYNAKIVGCIELTGDYQIEFTDIYSIGELNGIVNSVGKEPFIIQCDIHQLYTLDLELIPNDTEWSKENWNSFDGKDKNWGVEAINATGAWDYISSMRYVNVGIIDSMFYTSHEDIAYSKIWNNPDDLNNEKSYITRTHGTHVLGTMGAMFNNNKGIAGIVPRTNVYAFSILGDITDQEIQNNISGLMLWKYALANLISSNCKVINVSMAFSSYDKSSIKSVKTSLGVYLKKFIDKGYEFVIVNSAGNEGNKNVPLDFKLAENCGFFAGIDIPEVKDRIIVVGAAGNSKNSNTQSNKDGYNFADFSCYGNRVDVVAPGVNIYSTVISNKDNPKLYDSGYTDENLRWGTWSGTSQAAPHVSGIAAMCFSVNANLSGKQVKEIIKSTANNTPIYRTESGNQDLSIAYRMVNAKNAVEKAISLKGGSDNDNNEYGILLGTVSLNDITKNTSTEIKIEITSVNDSVKKYETNTNKDGQFEFVVPVGKYILTASCKDYESKTVSDIIITSSKTNVLSEISLDRQVKTITFSGKVTDEKGTLLDDVKVEITGGEYGETKTVNTKNGEYSISFDQRLAISYLISAEKSGYEKYTNTSFTLVSADVNFDIILEKNTQTQMTIPADAFNYNGHSYYIYSGNAETWEEAKAYCESLGGYLAVVNDEAENIALYNYMKSCGYQSAYFGYSDSETEGVWKWVSNDTSNYTNWASGEPNQERTTEDYAMFYFKYTDGKWNDGDFNGRTVQDTSAFICEWDSVDNGNKTIYLEQLAIKESDQYNDNEGDSFVFPIGKHRFTRGNTDINGVSYEHGIEGWIARWNYTAESSWAYSVFDLSGKYSSLNGKCVLIQSANTTDFDTTLDFIGDGNLIKSYHLTPDAIPFDINLNVLGVKDLKVYFHDNAAKKSGTSFGLVNMELKTTNSTDEPNIDWKAIYKKKLNETFQEWSSTGSAGTAKYELVDIDQNGIPELFISPAEFRVAACELYTISDGDLKQLQVSSMYGGLHYNSKEKIIGDVHVYNFGSSVFYWVAKLENGNIKEIYSSDAHGDTFTVNGENVTLEEYNAANAKYPIQSGEDWKFVGRKYSLNNVQEISTVIDNY